MLIRTEADVTPAVLNVMEQTKDPRLKEIMVALIKHLHGFVREVRLTEPEFRMATKLLNDLGQASDDKHNEPVLMAGSLGVSTLVCLLNNGDNGATETTQNLLGPFWRMHSPDTELGGSIVRSETPGTPMVVDLTFVDVHGQPIADLEVDVWHCSAEGFYENQEESQADHNLRGKFRTGADGRIWFTSVKQSGYPIPTHTVVGRLLEAQDRHPFRPAHLHVLAHKENYKTLISQIYSDDDPHLDSDVQFGVTAALIGRYVRHEDGHPDSAVTGPWFSLSHQLVVEPGESELPIPPIK
ncbi:dioxygenase [Cognatishimia sp. SS12]|uniref:dioxygenase family protein n=1 Tax=Cognatishimia sp. SS12 TaxID=2979465 RepID=UPI00232E5074|nr:dioxygenase [Cognatishimia sp. SS12]MDC0738060.1 dioxygenase [Cognatishimia sp. SS12]